MIKKHVLVTLIAALVLASSAVFAEEPKELTVFTAASLTGAFGEIGQVYENETGLSVAFNFDGSQALRTQLENGAYADVFASANKKQMNAVKNDGLMNNSSVVIFTKNKLSLIVPKDNPAQDRQPLRPRPGPASRSLWEQKMCRWATMPCRS